MQRRERALVRRRRGDRGASVRASASSRTAQTLPASHLHDHKPHSSVSRRRNSSANLAFRACVKAGQATTGRWRPRARAFRGDGRGRGAQQASSGSGAAAAIDAALSFSAHASCLRRSFIASTLFEVSLILVSYLAEAQAFHTGVQRRGTRQTHTTHDAVHHAWQQRSRGGPGPRGSAVSRRRSMCAYRCVACLVGGMLLCSALRAKRLTMLSALLCSHSTQNPHRARPAVARSSSNSSSSRRGLTVVAGENPTRRLRSDIGAEELQECEGRTAGAGTAQAAVHKRGTPLLSAAAETMAAAALHQGYQQHVISVRCEGGRLILAWPVGVKRKAARARRAAAQRARAAMPTRSSSARVRACAAAARSSTPFRRPASERPQKIVAQAQSAASSKQH